MNNPQEVIIYRNPADKMMWDAFMSGSAFPVIAGIVVFFCIYILGDCMIRRAFSLREAAQKQGLLITLAAVAGCTVTLLLVV